MLNNDEHNVERSDEILEKTHCCTPQKYLYRNFYFFKHNELKKCSTFLISRWWEIQYYCSSIRDKSSINWIWEIMYQLGYDGAIINIQLIYSFPSLHIFTLHFYWKFNFREYFLS